MSVRVNKIALALLLLWGAGVARAGVVDPFVIVEDSQKTMGPVARESVPDNSAWGQVTGTFKKFWNAAKNAVTPSPANKADVAKTRPAPAKVEKSAEEVQVEKLAQQLPTYTQEEKKTSDAQLKEARKALEPGLTRVVVPAELPQTDIPKNKAGVPVFPLVETKKEKGEDGKVKTVHIPKDVLPLLNVGKEARISKNDFLLKKINFGLSSYGAPKKLESPRAVADAEIQALKNRPISVAGPVKDFNKLGKEVAKPVSKESVAKVKWNIKGEKGVTLKEVVPMSEAEQKMLAALLMYQKGGQCHLVIGLFQEIAKGDSLKDEANFHLGSCAFQMQMHSAGFEKLSALIRQENPDYTTDALKVLSKNTPLRFEEPLYKLVSGLKGNWIKEDFANELNYRVAKGAFKADQYKDAQAWAKKVSEKSEFAASAQYLTAISLYSQGDSKGAMAKFEELLGWMSRKGVSDKNLTALIHLNLARVKFNAAQYQQAHAEFMKVDKEHPTWVQALTEQGWAQLALEDYAGAIGNMYSLHSPYFNAVYKPESFVVRAIGYLNICQYGDAYRTLSKLEQDYRDWQSRTVEYIKKSKEPISYYQTAISYLKGKSDQNVEGIPFQVIREAARQKYFINQQSGINQSVDEGARYAGVEGQIREEQGKLRKKQERAEERLKELRAKIEKAQANKTLEAGINTMIGNSRLERNFIAGYRYQIAMLDASIKGFEDFKVRAEKQLSKDQNALKVEAGKFLAKQFGRIREEMSRILDNNEFLRYEVFAGAGENIRYQVAGGEVKGAAKRVPAAVRPQKILNWNFDGEYWVDEIGSYRSSLQNLCPKKNQGRSAKAD